MKQFMFLLMLFCLGLVACKSTQPNTKSEKPVINKSDNKSEVIVGTETPGSLKFFAKNNRYAAEGSFEKWHFTKVAVPNQRGEDLTGMTASILIETASVTEKAEGLQKHLMQNDFLDVEKYPEATVEIKEVTKVEGNKYKGMAVVKIKTFSAEYPVDFEFTKDKHFHVKGEIVLLRKVFELGVGNENIENEVKVTFDTDLK